MGRLRGGNHVDSSRSMSEVRCADLCANRLALYYATTKHVFLCVFSSTKDDNHNHIICGGKVMLSTSQHVFLLVGIVVVFALLAFGLTR